MHRIRKKNFVHLLRIFLMGSIVLVAVGCDNMLSEKFKEKDYAITEIDALAAKTLVKDTLNDSQGVTIGYKSIRFASNPSINRGDSIKTRTLQSLVDTTTWGLFSRDSLTENQIYRMKFNEIKDSLQHTLAQDSLILINPFDQKTTYARWNVSGGSYYLYTSLRYTGANVNEYVSIELIKSDTSAVNYSTAMPVEAVSGATQMILVAQEKKIVPIIRGRFEYHLEAGIYLVRFTTSNPTVGQFKITILSF